MIISQQWADEIATHMYNSKVHLLFYAFTRDGHLLFNPFFCMSALPGPEYKLRPLSQFLKVVLTPLLLGLIYKVNNSIVLSYIYNKLY